MPEARFVRKKTVVDAKFQFGLALRVVSVLCSYLLLLCLIALFEPLQTLLSSTASDAAVLAAWDSVNFVVEGFLLPVALAFVCMTLHCILMLHRIAGPAYRIRRTLEAARERDISGNMKFRKGDYLTEVADQYNEAVAVFRDDLRRLRDGVKDLAECTQREREDGPPETRKAMNEVFERADNMLRVIDLWRITPPPPPEGPDAAAAAPSVGHAQDDAARPRLEGAAIGEE